MRPSAPRSPCPLAHMHQILFESDVVSGRPRAVGVAFKRGEGDLATLKTAKESGVVRARKEVILSAGAYNSPWLLVRAPANDVVWCVVCGVWCVKWVGCGVCACWTECVGVLMRGSVLVLVAIYGGGGGLSIPLHDRVHDDDLHYVGVLNVCVHDMFGACMTR